METLFLTKSLTGKEYFLQDSKNFLIGRFEDEANLLKGSKRNCLTAEEKAKLWCEQNGYRLRIKC